MRPRNSSGSIAIGARWLLLGMLVVIGAVALARVSTASAQQSRATNEAQQCADPYSAQRDPSNPLDLPTPPGPDPLNGANFFIPGPAHGAAAGAIAQLLGLNTKTLPDSESWSSFEQQLSSGPFAGQLAADPVLAGQVAELSKIASQPEAQRLSIYSEGGGPGAIFAQAEKLFCHNMTADPGSIPLINTYFLHPALGGCPTPAQVSAYGPTFRRRVDEMAAATGNRPAVYLLEIDAIGSSSCIEKMGSMPEWEADLRYEMNTMEALPHTVVYVEGGYSDANSVRYTAKVLNKIGIGSIRGFFTNDTHENWTINEVKWAQKISKLTHGAHFIVNTAENGDGPKVNRNPGRNGSFDLCNPPGRALGPMDTTDTGSTAADAFLWTHAPGNSSGSCGGGPASGTFWANYAVGLAARANQQLGLGLPARPY